MESLDGVAEFHMSGRRSVFALEPGEQLDREALSSAFEDNGLIFESVESIERPPVAAVFLADAGST